MGITYPAPLARWAKDVWGHFAVTQALYAGPAEYVTGGEAVTPGQVKLGVIEFVPPAVGMKSDRTDAVIYVYDRDNGKMVAYWANAGAASQLLEVTATTDLSGYPATMLFFGRG